MENLQGIVIGGTSSYEFKKINGVKILSKFCPKSLKTKLKSLEQRFVIPHLGGHPFKEHLFFPKNSQDYLDKEELTLNLWRGSYINSPKVINKSKGKIEYEFIPGALPLEYIFNQEYSMPKFEKFLETYDQIRSLAKKNKDKNLLHSDPHLGNFLYKGDFNEVIPIDPGQILNPERSFEELDIKLMGCTLYSIYNLKASEKIKEEYIRSFKDTLSKQERENLKLSLGQKVPSHVRIYFKIREEVAHRLKGREKIEVFESLPKFNNYIRKIFSE